MYALVDASVLIAGLYTKQQSASYFIVNGLVVDSIYWVITPSILKEVRRKIEGDTSALTKLAESMRHMRILPDPSAKAVARCTAAQCTSDQEDVHLIAAAHEYRVNWLVSLDKKHVLTEAVQLYLKNSRVVSPGALLEELRAMQAS